MEYSDSDARKLLEGLAKYAEAFQKTHQNPDITVKELADDLADSTDNYEPVMDLLRYRIYDGLNNTDFKGE